MCAILGLLPSLLYDGSFRMPVFLEEVLGYPAVWNGVVLNLEYTIWRAYPALGDKRLSFLPPESSSLCVWRTTDCKHCLATKELESTGEMDGCY